MERKALFFDIDGTLLTDDTKCLPESAAEAIKKARQAGHLVFINSGRARCLMQEVEEKLDVAFDEKLGYLTSCPTNLGTGLRASVILHLPGLVYTRNMHNITNISQQLGLSVRGLYGEGSETVGNIFVVSNQLTLGFSEQGIIENLTSAVGEIVAHERRARKALVAYSKERLEDAVWRAYGVLKYARSLGESEVLELISKVRMGVDMELLHVASPESFSELVLASRPSYLRNLVGNDNLSAAELDRKRAEMVRRVLAGPDDRE